MLHVQSPGLRRSFFAVAALVAVVVALCAFSASAMAADFVVNDDGVNTSCSFTDPASYITIQSAVAAAVASPGPDTVQICNGNYYGSVNISEDLTVIGESEDGVIISTYTAGEGNYGISALPTSPATGLTLNFSKFTLVGPGGIAQGNYGLKISGDTTVATLSDISVLYGGRTNVDLNGLDGATLTNITAKGAKWGGGITLTDVKNATLTDITTADNAWGGVGIFTYGRYYTGGSDNVAFAGTPNIGEALKVWIDVDAWNGIYPPLSNIDFAGKFPVMVTNPLSPDQFMFTDAAGQAALVAAVNTKFGNSDAAAVTVGGKIHLATPAFTINAAITAAAAGDTILLSPGTFAENVNVNKFVRIIGGGDSSLVELGNTTGLVSVGASGPSASDPLLLRNFRVEPDQQYGLNLGSVQHVKIDGVKVIGDSTGETDQPVLPALDTRETCLKVSTAASVDHLEIVDSVFNSCDYGWYVAKASGTDASDFSNISVLRTDFSYNSFKGVYVEKMSNTEFKDSTFRDNGWSSNVSNAAFNAGIDINLKYQAYANIKFTDISVTGNGRGFLNGAGLLVKARNDASSYNTDPATLDIVTISGGSYVGNERGIVVGEVGKANTGPTSVSISGAALYFNVPFSTGGTAYGDVVNYSTSMVTASGNWWGQASGPLLGQITAVAGGVGFTSISATPLPVVAVSIPDATKHLLTNATFFDVPVVVSPYASHVSSLNFTLDYDGACWDFASFQGVPSGFTASPESEDATNGLLTVAFYDGVGLPSAVLGGDVFSMRFSLKAGCNTDQAASAFDFVDAAGPTCGDAGGTSPACTFNDGEVTVDFDELPTALTLTDNLIDENQPAFSEVGGLSLKDTDGYGPLFTLDNTACGGPLNNAKFAVSGAKLLAVQPFDFETLPTSYEVCVAGYDLRGGATFEKLTINVTNVNEPPTAVSLSRNEFTVDETTANAVLADFSIVGDPDAPDAFTLPGYSCSIEAQSPGTPFAVSGLQLSVGTAPLGAGPYTVQVLCTDGTNPITSAVFNITVYGTASLSFGASDHGGVVRQNSGALTIPVAYNANGNLPTSLVFRVNFDKDCLAVDGATVGNDFVEFSFTNPTASTVMPTLSVAALASCPDNRTGAGMTPAMRADKLLQFSIVEYVKVALPLSISSSSASSVTVIDNSDRGNCNASLPVGSENPVNAADYVATVLEIFDGGSSSWLDAPVAGFDGSPFGCDSSQSGGVDVGDIVCTVHESFGTNQCAPSTAHINPASAAGLAVAAASAEAGAMVNVPVSFDAQGAQIGALVFTLKLDPAKVAFDATDADGDGNPDAIHFNLAAGQTAVALHDAAAGKINVAVFSVTSPMQPVNGNVASVSLMSLTGGDAGLVIDSASASTVDGVAVTVNGTTGFLPDRFIYLPMLIK